MMINSLNTSEERLLSALRERPQLASLVGAMVDMTSSGDIGKLTKQRLAEILEALPQSPKAARRTEAPGVSLQQMKRDLRADHRLCDKRSIYERYGLKEIPPLHDHVIKEAWKSCGLVMLECASPKKLISVLRRANKPISVSENDGWFSKDDTTRIPKWIILPARLISSVHRSDRERLGSSAVSWDPSLPTPEQLFAMHAYALLSGRPCPEEYQGKLALTNMPGVVVGLTDRGLVLRKDSTCWWDGVDYVYRPSWGIRHQG